MYPNITIKHDADEETTVISVTVDGIGVLLNCYPDEDGAAIIDVKESYGSRPPRRIAFIGDNVTRNDAPPSVTNSTDAMCNNGVTVLRDAFNQIDSYFREER